MTVLPMTMTGGSDAPLPWLSRSPHCNTEGRIQPLGSIHRMRRKRYDLSAYIAER